MTSSEIRRRKELLESRRKHRKTNPGPITAHYLDAAWSHRHDIPAMREAQGVLALYSKMELEFWPEELFCGTIKPREAAGFFYGSGSWTDSGMIEKMIVQDSMNETEAQALRSKSQWPDDVRYKGPHAPIYTPEERASMNACAADSTWFAGHMVLDYRTILEKGLGGYAETIRNAPDTPFYRAMSIQLLALQTLIRRYSEKVSACAQCPGYNAGRARQLSGMLEKIAQCSPETFEEALQLVWLLHIANGADSFGRFDSYLAPFYENDLKLGRLTREEAYDALVDIWMKIEDADMIQNMTIGGTRTDGSEEYGDLTLLCIEVTRDVALKGPNLCLRISKTMPDSLWTAALDCLETGIGLPALYHEEAYLRMLLAAGYDLPTGRDFCLAGCSQVMIPGQCNFINDIGLYNIAKIMELTLYGGVDPLTGVQVGPKTKRLPEMQSFDELYDAFSRQNRYFVRLETQIHDKEAVYRGEHEGYAMRSLFTRGCLESGKGVFEGGARYNNIELEIIGITNAADSLYAVKKAVFDDARFTGAQLLALLECDFEGHETDRLYLKNRIAKFGNDDPEIDELRARIAHETYRAFNDTPAVFGGVYVPGEVIFTAHERTGAMIGATPDGRHAHQVLADSMGASQGLDRNGPTALMASVNRTKAADYFLTTPILNLRFLVSTWQSARERGSLKKLLQQYFTGGGMQLQINVCDGRILREALLDPEKYRSLVVRVGGYSDYFVNLTPKLQQEIINRTEQML